MLQLNTVKNGIKKSTVKRTSSKKEKKMGNVISFLQEVTGLSAEKLSKILQVTFQTVTRWKKNGQIPAGRDQCFSRIKEIVDLGLQVYTVEGLKAFINEAQPVFGNKSAFQLLVSQDYDTILDVLADDFEGLN